VSQPVSSQPPLADCYDLAVIGGGINGAGFDVGRETTQGMPSTSTLVKPLEHYKRQRRAFRSRRLSGEPLH